MRRLTNEQNLRGVRCMSEMKWWLNMSDDEMKKSNPHLAHLVGKTMSELKQMFPDAKICDSKICGFTDLDHAVFMESEQHDIDMQRKGMIKVMYRDLDGSNKIFFWYDGKQWVELKQ